MEEEKNNSNNIGGKSNKNLKKMPPLMVIGIVVVLVMILAFLVYLITLADNAVYEVKNEVGNKVENIVNNTEVISNTVQDYETEDEVDNETEDEDDYMKEYRERVASYDRDNASLEMIDFTYDNSNLIVKFNLKFKEKPEYSFKELSISSRVLIDGIYYNLPAMNTDRFEQVSDLEYIQTVRYDISNIKDSKDVKILITLRHYDEDMLNKYLGASIGPVNKWEFTKDLKITSRIEQMYYIGDKYIKLFETKEITGYIPKDKYDEYYVQLLGVCESDKYTRFIFTANLEFMAGYCIEILGENGNVIIEKNKEKLSPAGIFEVLTDKKIDLNQKITINIYKNLYDPDTDTSSYELDGTMSLNIKENITEPINTELPYDEKIWECFTIKAPAEFIDQYSDDNINIEANKIVDGVKYLIKYIKIDKISNDKDLESIIKEMRFNEINTGGFLADDGSTFTLFGEIELPDSKVQEIMEKGSCEYKSKKYTESELLKAAEKEVTKINSENIKGITVYNYHVAGDECYSKYYVSIDGNNYCIEIPRDISLFYDVLNVIINIKLN